MTALLLAAALAASPGPAATFALGSHGDLFEGATQLDAARLALEARPAFFALPDDRRRAVAGEIFERWTDASGVRYLEVNGLDGGEVYRSLAGEPVGVVSGWRARPAEAPAAAPRKWTWYGGAWTSLSLLPFGFVYFLRAGTFLYAGRYDASVGLTNAGGGVGLPVMGRMHFLLDGHPLVSPNVGIQILPRVGDGGLSFDAGAAVGVTLRPEGAQGMVDVSLVVGLETQTLAVGYILLF